jgi:hypothetical protein
MTLFNYETPYLKDSVLLTTASQTATSQMDSIKTTLNDVDTALSNGQYANVVSQQQAVKQMIDTENTRLQQKKQSIDHSSEGQQRIMQLNDSYVKRGREYLKIVVAVVFILGTLAAIYALNGVVEGGMFPDGVVTFITIILLALLCIYAVTTYIGILQRDKINFDKINPGALPPVSSSATQSTTKSGQNLFGQLDVGACVGSSCCAQGTQWEIATQTCRPVCPSATPNWNNKDGTCVSNNGRSNATPNWNALTGEWAAECTDGKIWDNKQYQCTRSTAGFATMDTAYQLGEMPPPRKTLPRELSTPPYVPTTVFSGNKLM